MIIQIKNLRGEQSNLEIQPQFTVLDVKRMIETNQGHSVDSQKLLFKGRILEDEKPLTDYQITENAILVLMVTKKPQARPEPAQNQQADILVPQQEAAPQASEEEVTRLMELGYPREEVTAALQAARNNSAIAAEFLMSGYIPMAENEEAEFEEGDEEEFEEGAEEVTSTTFDFLLQSPEFQSIREVILQNPSELEGFLQQLETTNPDLFALINENMDEFLRIIGGRRRPRGTVEIRLSQEEQNDLRELIDLGFSQEDALQAYLSCDKNKSMAANLLFENFQQNLGGQGFS